MLSNGFRMCFCIIDLVGQSPYLLLLLLEHHRENSNQVLIENRFGSWTLGSLIQCQH